MRWFFLSLSFFVALCGPAVAQDVSGRWQGTLNNGNAVRVVMTITKAANGGYTGERYLIDQSAHPAPLDGMELKGRTITFKQGGGDYLGQLSADGRSIKGTLNLGQSLKLDFVRAPKTGAWPVPVVPHTTKMIAVDDGVKIEVVDWGGSGPPLIFLAGLGANAHVFDLFAARFVGKHHVYGLTRRGYGASDKPDPATSSYAADRLADDVLEVMTQLNIEKPVLAGWSIAGVELSAVAARVPEKIAGLVYLDAAYVYAFYSPGMAVPPGDSLLIDANDLGEKIRKLPGLPNAEALALLDDLIATNLPQLQADLQATRDYYRATTPSPAPVAPPSPPAPPSLDNRIGHAVLEGMQKFAAVTPPVMAIYALPGLWPPNGTEAQLNSARLIDAGKEEQAKRFQAAHPSARIVRLANADHAVFVSHPDDVFREMDAFLDGLAK